MIIKNYEELKDFFENNYDKNQEDFINAHESGRYKIFDSERLILKFDDDGNYTSYPNEKLRKSKFKIRKKHCNLDIPEHRHEYIEIIYILEGEMYMEIDGKIIATFNLI